MKKSLCFTAVCAAAIMSVSFASCGDAVPSTLSFAGDLQELYGGEKGYPQAVLVVKNSVLESDGGAVGTLLGYFEESGSYLETASGAEVARLLQDKYPSGQTPTFNAKNLTAEVIANCSVRFTKSADCKEEVNAFLQKLAAVDPEFTKTADDSFYYTQTPAAADSEGSYTVYAPDGAPALALANAVRNSTGNLFEYHIVAGASIAAQVTFEDADKNADFCILPVNAAAKILGNGQRYRMLGTVTNGNMYFLGAGEQTALTAENLKTALKGKTVGVVQLTNVPGLTFRAVLETAGIEYEILGNDLPSRGDKVYLKAIQTPASDITPAGGCDYYLCAEPVASAKVAAFQKK